MQYNATHHCFGQCLNVEQEAQLSLRKPMILRACNFNEDIGLMNQ